MSSESTIDIKDLINDQKKEFEQSSLCHNQTGRWLSTLSNWFQIITGIAALFALGKDTIEWAKIIDRTEAETVSLGISTVCSIIIEIIVIFNRVYEPAKNSELHFQKSDMLLNMQKLIVYKRIKCRNYDDYNELHSEICDMSSKLPMVRIPDWAKKKVNNQLKEGIETIQDMREHRRDDTLKRSGVILNKYDKQLYRGLEKMSVDRLREIANSITVQKLDKHTHIPINLMNHNELLDHLKCNIGIRSSNLTEKHRNDILRNVNKILIENHLTHEISRPYKEESHVIFDINNVNDIRKDNIILISENSISSNDNNQEGKIKEKKDLKCFANTNETWQEPPPYILSPTVSPL